MVNVSPERFEALVAEALDGLPPSLGAQMRNVAVVVEDASPDGDLLGLYEGIPLTERGWDYSGVLPDRITLFRADLAHFCASEEELVAEVRTTVVHEVAHHFGIDDRTLEELGW